MTRESYEWLNENTLIGFKATRGDQWWPNLPGYHNGYDAEVPLEDAVKFFGRWHPVVADVLFEDINGKLRGSTGSEQLLYRSDDYQTLGIHGDGYQIHDRVKWLVDNVSNIIDGRLMIASVGEVKGGRVAWVQVEAPDTIEHSSGESFRPFIAATTSLDGSLATSYKAGSTRIVCDNTRDAFFAGKDGRYKIKHTRHSTSEYKIADARAALDVVFKVTEDYVTEMETLLATTVTGKQWDGFLDVYAAVPTEDGRGKTMAENRRMALSDLYVNDARVTPWAGTAWGVLQAANTYNTHLSIVRNAGDRVERQWSNFLTSKVAKEDEKAMKALEMVLAQV
jgi:phage/plasmid-like protein (TIGR03299 family)